MAGSVAAQEAVYLNGFLNELGLSDGSVRLGMDNQGAIDLSYNPEHHAKTKHIERRHYFIRDMVESHAIHVPFVRSSENMADFFTKPLNSAQFFAMRRVIMNER